MGRVLRNLVLSAILADNAQGQLVHALAGRDRRFSKRGVLDGRELEVVYTEDARRICVITVAWKE